MKTKKKLVDLVYLDNRPLESNLKEDYQSKINIWLEWSNTQMGGIGTVEKSEYLALNEYLNNFLVPRLEWISNTVNNAELRTRYMLALLPFNQHGNIKNFLLHFFQFEDNVKTRKLNLSYLFDYEREIRILWDVYKVTKTLDSIFVMLDAMTEAKPFSSIFSKTYIVKLLDTLYSLFSELIKTAIKPEYHFEILNNFPMSCFSPESILNRRVTNHYIINDEMLKKYDFRNYLFHLFYKSSLKIDNNGQNLTFKFNYLDYEIIRQEFLINWINQKLNNNPNKRAVYDQYRVGDQTLNQIIDNNPELELTLLKQLPKHIFDDLIADVNEVVEEKYKSPIEPMSETIGKFAEQFLDFQKAKGFAQKSLEAIQKFVTTLKDQTRKKSDDSLKGKKKSTETETKPQINIQVNIINKEDIDCPFLTIDSSNFNQKLSIIKSKMQFYVYEMFNKKVTQLLNVMDDTKLIKRQIPIPEWSVPFLLKESGAEKNHTHLLVIGAEARKKELNKSYGLGLKESIELKPYFVYGSQKRQSNFGVTTETRIIKGNQFYIYSCANQAVLNKALQLMDIILN